MIEFIEKLPGGEIIVGAIIVTLGVAAGFYALDAYKSKKREEINQTEDRLIELLKKTVEELETKVKQQDSDIRSLTEKVDGLKRENDFLVKVLQGRDERMEKFYLEATESMKITADTNQLVVTMSGNVARLCEILERSLTRIETGLDKK